MTPKKTGGHYDEMSTIQRLRNSQLHEIQTRLNRRKSEQQVVREQSYPNHIRNLRKTTTRKAPAGHH